MQRAAHAAADSNLRVALNSILTNDCQYTLLVPRAHFAQSRQRVLGKCIPLRGGEAVPSDGLCSVLRNNLGAMFENGIVSIGVAKDRAEAIRWYRLAAAQGHPSTQYSLAGLGA